MKSLQALLMVVLIAGLADPARAWFTQPIADDARTDAGLMRVGGGITVESDVHLYGARFTYGLVQDLAVFIGGGVVDDDLMGSEPFAQIGGLYQLPLADLPFDLAVRAAFGIADTFENDYSSLRRRHKEELDVWMLNVGLLGSKAIDALTVYGLVGLSYQRYRVKETITQFDSMAARRLYTRRSSYSDDETELAVAAGLLVTATERISFYGELAHIDELFTSLGIQYQF